MSRENIQFVTIVLFAGAGGETTGNENAEVNGQKVSTTIAAVNHDAIAIDSHKENHLKVHHYVEDVRNLDVHKLKEVLDHYRRLYPNAKIKLQASLECTNFSKAKGGLPRNADSRTLAETLYMTWDSSSNAYYIGDSYIQILDPDYIEIENVEEFMSWGPLDGNGKPVSKLAGTDYIKWRDTIMSMGYNYEYRLINSADLGAYTSRKRFFGIFAKHGLPIAWPVATHAKNPDKDGLQPGLKKWKAVRDVLDLNDHGNTIFGRKKDLSEKTLARIYAGLIKYVAGGKEAFLLKYNSINKQTGKHVPPGIDEPAPTIAVQNRLGLVHAQFLSKYFSGNPEHKNITIEGPTGAIKCVDSHSMISAEFIMASNGGNPSAKVASTDSASRVITASDNKALVQPQFMMHYHGKWDDSKSIENPFGTITTKDRAAFVSAQFLDKQYTTGNHNNSSIESPAGALLQVNKHALVSCETPFVMDTQFNNSGSSIENPLGVITANRKYHYLVNPQWQVNSGSGMDAPSFTLIARMDKTPPYLITTEEGFIAIEIYATDSEFTLKIKEFMALYGIIDIKMRMLKVNELLKIQGFPDGYILKGTQADQKKFIGNSVVPLVAQRITEALAAKLIEVDEMEEAA